MKINVILHFVHGGNKSILVTEKEFNEVIQQQLKNIDEGSDGVKGFFSFDNAMIPIREIKYIEWKRIKFK